MKTLFILILAGTVCRATAQEMPVDSIPAPVEAPAKSTLTAGISYMNNASYYGQRSIEKTPYIALLASWKHKSGFYLTALGYRLLKDSAKLASAYSVGAGYQFALSKKLSADFSYNYSIYPELSPFLQAANPHNANITLTHTAWLTTSIGIDFAFGKTNDVFGTAGVSKEITLFSPGTKDVVSFTPAVEISAGTQRFYEYYVEEKRTRDSVLGLPVLPIFGGGGTTTTTTTTKTKTQIDLLSYNLKLPLAYSRAHYTLELSYQLSLLGKKAQTGSGDVNSFFGAAFYYQF